MEDITRIEGIVLEAINEPHRFTIYPSTKSATGLSRAGVLFISKDATPPKVVALEEVLPYMQHKDDCLFGREQYLILIGHLNSTTDPKPCTCKMSEVLQRINDRSK